MEAKKMFSGLFTMAMVLMIGAEVIKTINFNSRFEALTSKIDEKLMVKRFWLIGKAYKKSLEVIR